MPPTHRHLGSPSAAGSASSSDCSTGGGSPEAAIVTADRQEESGEVTEKGKGRASDQLDRESLEGESCRERETSFATDTDSDPDDGREVERARSIHHHELAKASTSPLYTPHLPSSPSFRPISAYSTLPRSTPHHHLANASLPSLDRLPSDLSISMARTASTLVALDPAPGASQSDSAREARALCPGKLNSRAALQNRSLPSSLPPYSND